MLLFSLSNLKAVLCGGWKNADLQIQLNVDSMHAVLCYSPTLGQYDWPIWTYMDMAHSNTYALQSVHSALHHITIHFRRAENRCPHADWVPESFFSPNRRKWMYISPGAVYSPAWTPRVKSQQHIHLLPGTVWSRNYRVQPGVMTLRNLNFSNVFFQDQIWMEIKDYWGVFLCMLIALELNIRELIFCSF